ncbi:hypothetical protein BRD18_01385 [Halobacteriales archaeon SW_7_71_33]|nr:MAG: hypothetical protein BRD18_01385 [Halobacteriales archaeon SW_7_71_33]
MTVFADYRLGAEDLALGRAAPSGVTAELARVFEDPETVVGYVWVCGDDVDRFRSALTDQRPVETARFVETGPDRHLLRYEYRDGSGDLLSAALDHDADVLEAAGDGDRWRTLLEFPDGDRLARFQTSVADGESVSPELNCAYGVADPRTTDGGLTERQRETLVAAYRGGYYDIPRRKTLVDLAAELGVSDQAVSERLRRGERKVIHERLFGE